MLGWEGEITDCDVLAKLTVPVRFATWTFERVLPPPMKKGAVTFPLEKRPVRVPRLVMLGWEGLVTTTDVGTVETLAPFMFEIPEPLETIKSPCTERPVNVPTDVTFGWAGWDTTRATLALATFPTRLEDLRFEIPEPFPEYRVDETDERFDKPETFRVVRTPTDVMLSWAGLVTTPATLAAATFPIKFEELRFEIPEPLEATSSP